MKITDTLRKSCVRVPLRSREKIAVMTELVDLLDEDGQLTDRDEALKAVLAREKTRSTGIGRALAVPHGKSHGCRRLAIALGKPATPMDFEAVDGRPCEFIVLLTSPADKTGPHIQALASISRLWQHDDFRKAVAQAQTADDLYAAIERHQD
ncbi:MAG: PTS sugar transporter subunit IIA [Phycisphaerales bacterium]|nr:MAG: PTS sugar transporter subunit IIA [Phycisphaerales bacterium]